MSGRGIYVFVAFVCFINKNCGVVGTTWRSLEKLNNLKGIKKGPDFTQTTICQEYSHLFLYYSWHLKSSNVTTIFHNLGQQTKKLFMVFPFFLQKMKRQGDIYIRGISHDLTLVLYASASGRRLLRHVVFPPFTECVLF